MSAIHSFAKLENRGEYNMGPKYIRVNETGNTGYTIDKDSTSSTPWGNINKTSIKNKLALDRENNVPGVNGAIKEVYAIVGSLSDKNSWKYPHHILRGNTVILNKNGLASAAGYLAQDNTNPVDQRRKAARHLKRHYRKLDLEIPEGLNAVTESAHSNQHAGELIDWLNNMDVEQVKSKDDGSLASLV